MVPPVFNRVLPALVAHADWSLHPRKRWLACARLNEEGTYRLAAPIPAGESATLLVRLREAAGPGGRVLLGFDFPIGLPLRYAEQNAVRDFPALLPQLGSGEWRDFYHPAETPEQIHQRRPFYPARPGGARMEHLEKGLNLSRQELRRRCELGHAHRRPAAPLFWTIGAQQVGKAALSGWAEVLGPALRLSQGDPARVALWPFAGTLNDLLSSSQVVIAETYPGEIYHHLGIRFGRTGTLPETEGNRPIAGGRRWGKRSQAGRRRNAAPLLAWAERGNLQLEPELEKTLCTGFGPHADGEDRFDAVVGLCGMLNILAGQREPGEPEDETLRRVEGWILGQRVWGNSRVADEGLNPV